MRNPRLNHLTGSALVLAVTGVLALTPSAVSAATGAATARPTKAATGAATARPPRTVYVVTFADPSVLYRLKPGSHKETLKGNTGVELTDIAFRGRTLYAVSFTTLYTLDVTTGASHAVGGLGLIGANALVAQPKTNTLYGADEGGDFFKINHRNARVTMIGSYGHDLGSSGDLTFARHRLYATVFKESSSRTRSFLARINLRTGAAKIIGNTGYNNVYGLVSRNGALFGTTFGGKFISISRRTGRGKLIWKDGLAVGGATK
jgi:hypothetical protein